MKRSLWRLIPIGAIFPIASLACNQALVGGRCLAGYVERGGECVESPSNPSSANGTGGAGGAWAAGGAGGVGGHGSTGTIEPSGGPGGEGSSSKTGSGGSTTSQGGAGGGGGGCTAPLSSCPSGCVDLETDPMSCGECGHVCATATCTAGICDGAVAGHVVVLGIDYEQIASGTSPARLLGNSVFLSTHSPLRVMDFRVSSDPAPPAHVQALLASEAAFRGRPISINQVSDATIAAQALTLVQTDVFVIHVPVNASVGSVNSMASQWATPLDAFEKNGGVVVTLVGSTTPTIVGALLTQSALFPDATSCGAATGSFSVTQFLDSIATGIPSVFSAPGAGTALSFSGVVSQTVSIPVVDQASAPIALHRVILPN